MGLLAGHMHGMWSVGACAQYRSSLLAGRSVTEASERSFLRRASRRPHRLHRPLHHEPRKRYGPSRGPTDNYSILVVARRGHLSLSQRGSRCHRQGPVHSPHSSMHSGAGGDSRSAGENFTQAGVRWPSAGASSRHGRYVYDNECRSQQ